MYPAAGAKLLRPSIEPKIRDISEAVTGQGDGTIDAQCSCILVQKLLGK
jgi:hypothetical protein